MHHNYFHDHSGSGTPAEAYRIGSSESAWLDFQAEVSYNRFERISGETELATNKGSGINIHDNTFLDCNSSLTLRHGNNNRVEDNLFIHSGLRIYGHGHIVRGNQIIDDPNNQLRQSLMIGAGTDANDSGSPGQPGSSNSIHAQVRDTLIENNIIVNSIDIGSRVNLQLGFGSIISPYPPIDNNIRNNIIYGTNTGTLTGVDNDASWADNNVSGNIVYATGSASSGNMPSENIDPLLQRDADGIYRFTANSPQQWTQNYVLLRPADVGPMAP
jgi:poly(beta-D-mannuronate) lyase